ncbi:MAG: GAF domain-containing protein [Elusimicrobia bacterium]|nr:GAF domain-containing protein [Elusimicrobiota bacterium]
MTQEEAAKGRDARSVGEGKTTEATVPGEAAVAARTRAWVYEIPVFYGLLFSLQRAAFPELPGFRGVEPNPYWLGVLLFGLRYGLGAGAASGVASAALLVYGTWATGEGFRLEDADFYFQPGLFVLLGVALGFVADRWEHTRSALRRRIEDMAGRNRGLQNQIHLQQKAMRAVEQQVVSQMSSVVTLYHGSQELGTLDRQALFPAMLDFFTQALQATKTAFYVHQDGRWILLDQRGWDGPEDYPRAIDSGTGIIGKAASERRVISLRDLLVAEADDSPSVGAKSDAIMAAPLLDPGGEVVAVFAVQAMPFLRFNSASVNLATLLAEWGGESLAKALEVEALKSRSLLDEDYGVHSASYFQNRLRQEFSRSRRYALPLSVLLMGVDLEEVPEARRVDALRVLARLLRETTRDIDIVSRTPLAAAPFGVVLATSTGEQARGVADRVRKDLEKLQFPGRVRVGIGSFKHSMENPEDIVEQARAELG